MNKEISDAERIKQLEEELIRSKQIIATLEKTIKNLQEQYSAAKILLSDFDPKAVI
jgi:hypothetical protein